MSDKSTKIFVIVPAFNEGKYISRVLKRLNSKKVDYVVIDDGSEDDTYEIAKKHAQHVLRHKVNLGKGAALRTGCQYAFQELDATHVVFLDSDDQHDIEELALFEGKINEGAHMILGVRSFGSDMPLIRIMGNRLASFLVFVLFGRYIPDIPSGYKAMSRNTYERFRLSSCDYRIELEIAVKIAKLRMRFDTVPIKTIYHDMDRGFQVIDSIKMVLYLLQWRLTP